MWYVHELLKYEFDLEFELPVTYPNVAPELALPELDGKTEKMYRGGKICLDSHFRPLWARNVPHFGIAHAMALGVRTCAMAPFPRRLTPCINPLQMGPWLAVEIPALVANGRCALPRTAHGPLRPKAALRLPWPIVSDRHTGAAFSLRTGSRKMIPRNERFVWNVGSTLRYTP